MALRVKDQEASKKAAEVVAKKNAEDKAKEEAAEAELVNGIAKKWKSYATGGKITTPSGEVRSHLLRWLECNMTDCRLCLGVGVSRRRFDSAGWHALRVVSVRAHPPESLRTSTHCVFVHSHASKVGMRLHTPAVGVIGECSVSRADQLSWFVRYVRLLSRCVPSLT